MKYSVCILLLISLCMQSCYEIRSVQISEERTIAHYEGNRYQQMVGMTKNQLLRAMPPLTRSVDDGENGEILIWENIADYENRIAPIGTFVSFYIDTIGVSYDCSTNVGNIYTYETIPAEYKCYKCWANGTLREGSILYEVPCNGPKQIQQYKQINNIK